MKRTKLQEEVRSLLISVRGMTPRQADRKIRGTDAETLEKWKAGIMVPAPRPVRTSPTGCSAKIGSHSTRKADS